MKKVLVGVFLLVLVALLYRKYQVGQPPTNESQVGTNVESVTKTVTRVPATYKVQAGEGLWHVAEKELGSGEKWRELALANEIKKPYLLAVGQELKIPGKETEVVTESSNEKTFSLEQVAEHATKDSCWLALEGKVYDVTPFVASGFHPGKEAILEGCGRDATELFNTRPMGSQTPHSERARKMLPKYLIGQLTQS
jgi:cytochrome b involved in lipid metabolism